MNELHISLAIVGAVIILGVYLFNRYQERKFRRRLERDFAGGSEDVLLKRTGDEALQNERREPGMAESGQDFGGDEKEILSDIPTLTEERSAAPMSEPPPEPPAPLPQTIDEVVDYVAEIYPREPVAATVVHELEDKFDRFPRPVRLLGQNVRTGMMELVTGGQHSYDKLMVALQLVNRSGALAAAELKDFCSRTQAFADALTAIVEMPEQSAAMARAATLDEFCVSVDVLIGINVVTAGGETIRATNIRAMAESAGMKLKADGAFHARDDNDLPLFSLSNFELPAFSADNIRHLSTHGVTLLLDVPVVANGARVIDQMVVLARQIAESFSGLLVDDNRRPLSEAGIAKIKQQLATIYIKMDAAGIPAGGERALRLFS